MNKGPKNQNPNQKIIKQEQNPNIPTEIPKINPPKIDENKPNKTRTKKNNYPILSLSSLFENNYEDNQRNNDLKIRIRFNRNNKITIDRYRQVKNDFNPFHDNYNDEINKYKFYDKFRYNYLDDKNFENLFNSYNVSRVKDLNLLYDSDEDSTDLNNDIKHFSTSYKQYLKMKRAHS